MTGTGKTDKKFHTLQHQISVVFICLLLLSIFTITLINGLFLEKILCIQKSRSAGGGKRSVVSDESG